MSQISSVFQFLELLSQSLKILSLAANFLRDVTRFIRNTCVDFHRSNNVVLPTWNITGSIPSTFWLTTYLLAVL
jgi:hypothetical protein